jgi:hypothetical protein
MSGAPSYANVDEDDNNVDGVMVWDLMFLFVLLLIAFLFSAPQQCGVEEPLGEEVHATMVYRPWRPQRGVAVP